LLRRLEKFVTRGIVIFSPLGRVRQDPYDHNILQRHQSFWKARDFSRLGYTVAVYEGMHGQLNPPADAAWAIKGLGTIQIPVPEPAIIPIVHPARAEIASRPQIIEAPRF
jgi:hypothetical protein